MTPDKSSRSAFLLGLVALAAAAGGVQAQSVSASGDRVEIFDTDADSAILVDSGANYTAGGNGRTATLNLRGSDGPTTLFYHAFQVQLILGGGNHEGILSIKDDDGVTTTIDLDGRIGRVLLGALGEDGDVIVNAGTGTETIRMNGAGGTVTNSEDGNGLVKAWARVNADGSVAACRHCTEVTVFAGGVYSVTFTQNIAQRPKTALIDSHGAAAPSPGTIRLRSGGGTHSVSVYTTDLAGVGDELPFTLVIY